MQFRLGLHSSAEDDEKSTKMDIMGVRLGSSEGCRDIEVPEGTFIKNIFVKANGEMIRTITLESSDGYTLTIGEDPIVE